ncbi:aminopeptidase N-like isoform X2 [Panulirus ornatus]
MTTMMVLMGTTRSCVLLLMAVSATLATPATTSTPSTTSTPTVDGVGKVTLPKNLVPIHYEVRLQPFINGNFSVHGRVHVQFRVLEPTHHIVMHMADMLTHNHTTKVIEATSGQEQKILQQEYISTTMMYIVHLQEQLAHGGHYTLSLDFVGTLAEQLRGFYRSSYTKENGETSWVASTQLASAEARRVFPCFDEPALRATFKIFLAREQHMKALSNMPLLNSTPIEDQEGWMWDEFETSVPMSTYLVAFTISDYPARVVHHHDNNGTLLRVWAREAVYNKLDYGSRVGSLGLQFFQEFFGVDYPLPKLDFVCPPEMSPNAMENWGLITYRESALVYDPATSPATQKQWTCYLVAHELAHQWFGNLVTMSWWTDLWLSEGFATYMGDTAVDYIEPSWGMLDQFVVKRQQKVMALDALRSSHPVCVPIDDPADINEIFDIISYSKGASIIRMMKHFLTEATFRRGLKTYLTELKYKSAKQDDLWRYLTEAAHEDGTLPDDLTVKIIMDTWTLQMGYPVVSIARAGNSSAVITQEHFLLDRSSENDVRFPHNWWIPVTYTTQDKPDFDNIRVNFWLNGLGIQPASYIGYPQPDQWIIFNVKQTGYYRVNYDEANWELLTRQLQENHEVIHVTNRAQLIDDALNLARAGHLSYRVALGVISYLAKERHYVAWKAAFNNLQYLRDMFYRDQAFGALKDYLVSLILPVYRSVGFEERQGDDLQTQLLRGEVMTWACNLGHPDCRHNALQLFRGWMADPENFEGISANVAASVYCTAIRAGGEDEWNFAWRHSRDTGASNLADALSCTEEIWLLARYLEGAFNASSGIRRQNAANTFRSIAAGPVGNILAWDFLRSQWSRITNYIGATFFALPTMIEDVTKTFNTAQQLKELVEFDQENVGRLLTGKRAVLQAVEVTKINVDWMEKNRDLIVDWLENQGFSCHLSGIML